MKAISMLVLLVIAVIIITITPNFVLGLSKSTDNNNNNTKDWNFYLANSHNLTALNATGTLKSCRATDMIGPCWDSPYGSVRP